MASGKKRTRRNPGSSTPRVNRPATPPAASPAASGEPRSVRQPAASAPRATPASAAPGAEAPVRRSDAVDWSNEYSYVIGDLKQMAVVTVGLFAVMIAIGFML